MQQPYTQHMVIYTHEQLNILPHTSGQLS